MIVDDNTTSGTGSQSNSTTEVGGTQSRSTASPEEFAQMIAFCLATAIQQPFHVLTGAPSLGIRRMSGNEKDPIKFTSE